MRGRIIRNTKIIGGHFLLTVTLPESFQTPMPGQFVMVREKGRLDPLLGRPFSIYSFERLSNSVIIEILYKVVGKQTTLLSILKEDVLLEIYGPYGSAFDVTANVQKIVLICGGIGIAPITFLATHYQRIKDAGRVKLFCYLGAQEASKLVGVERIKELCPDVFISTDDGSVGYHGFITEFFLQHIALYDPGDATMYACGPRPMLKRLSEILTVNPLSCQASLEERMACGVGACLGCSIATQDREGENSYKRVCKDGPVFDIHDIIWN